MTPKELMEYLQWNIDQGHLDPDKSVIIGDHVNYDIGSHATLMAVAHLSVNRYDRRLSITYIAPEDPDDRRYP